MRRAWRTPLVVLACVAGAAGIVASCTTFDGATVPPQDASTELPTTVDAPREAPAETSAGPPGYLSVGEAATLCTLIFQCQYLASSVLQSVAVPVDPVNYSLCVHWLAGPIPTDRVGFAVQSQTFQCMAAATTCAAAGSCLSLENLAPNDPRCADAGADAAEHCGDDGGTVFRCGASYLLHCGSAYYAPGARCLTGDDGTHWCALGNNCSVQDSCLGTINDYCGVPSNLHFGVNCAYDGYTCGMALNDDSGLNNCNTGNMYLPCSNPGTSCSGSTLLQVCDGQDLSNFNCASLGDTCSTQGGAAICAHSGDTCTPFDNGENQCSGSSISLCVGGHPVTFDCASIGKTCVPASGATSGHCG
ncbi:MAG TPA: hypothetical protein VF765_28030 [Polyangiaceae bacterium]